MPFDWYKSAVNEKSAPSSDSKAQDSYRSEIRKHAVLLKNLGYAKDYAAYRIKSNFAWEFELSSLPPVFAEIDGIVESVFA